MLVTKECLLYAISVEFHHLYIHCIVFKVKLAFWNILLFEWYSERPPFGNGLSNIAHLKNPARFCVLETKHQIN